MNFNKTASYKLENQENDNVIYLFKLTAELAHELENSENLDKIELIANDSDKSGILTLPLSNNKYQKFDLSFSDISDAKYDIGYIRSNNRMTSLGNVQGRVTAKATSKSYDMTKKKFSTIEDENKKHIAKELKLNTSNPKKGLPIKFSDKNNILVKASKVGAINSHSSSNSNSIRSKILHILAVKPISYNTLLLMLNKYGVTSNDRNEIQKVLKQISTINSNNDYVLASQFFSEVDERWPNYNESDRRKVASFKEKLISTPFEAKVSGKNFTSDSREPQKRSSYPIGIKVNALDMLNSGASIKDTCCHFNVPENLLSVWKSNEFKIRQNYQRQKASQANLKPIGSQYLTSTNSTIPVNPFSNVTSNTVTANKHVISTPNNKHSTEEDDCVSYKTANSSNDEGFASGDKISPQSNKSISNSSNNSSNMPLKSNAIMNNPFLPDKPLCNNANTEIQSNTNKNDKTSNRCLENVNRKRSAATTNPFSDVVQPKKSKISPPNDLRPITKSNTSSAHSNRNGNHSSSSCEVTPKSDVSPISKSFNSSKPQPPQSDFLNSNLNDNNANDAHKKYNAAFEEYSKLTAKFEEREKQIEKLRQQCKSDSNDYKKLKVVANSLLSEMNSPQFKTLINRIKQLEADMMRYCRVLTQSRN